MTDSYGVKNAQKIASDALDETKHLQPLYSRDFALETLSFLSTSN